VGIGVGGAHLGGPERPGGVPPCPPIPDVPHRLGAHPAGLPRGASAREVRLQVRRGDVDVGVCRLAWVGSPWTICAFGSIQHVSS
jgi:hypothetical protein